ncbi:Sorting nexin-2 [Tupaia chinensis]|uniref:Sorting nexin-2 n=1 Tax=Tupaia chinensis TaxID=246437 RepID=L8Y8A0_TUPCH|nr:Sorting nexin-2 [Tupaia chinensis]
MAAEREPPPLGDAKPTDFEELEDGEDLFTSTVSTLEIEEDANGDIFDIEIGVSDPEKVGDGMNAYMAYRVTTKLPRAVNTQALSGAGILRMVNKAADAVNKMTIKMNESDAWFEEKQQQFENLDQQLRKLHASVEALVCHRKELSANTAAFAKSAAMLGNSEDHTALSRALSQLAEVEEKIDQLHQEQAFADFYMFSELLSDYIRLIAAVKLIKYWEAFLPEAKAIA